jgi:hypothetical protein
MKTIYLIIASTFLASTAVTAQQIECERTVGKIRSTIQISNDQFVSGVIVAGTFIDPQVTSGTVDWTNEYSAILHVKQSEGDQIDGIWQTGDHVLDFYVDKKNALLDETQKFACIAH